MSSRLFILLLIAISYIVAVLGGTISQTGNNVNLTDAQLRKKALSLSDELHPFCDWRLTTEGCRNNWIHESILGVSLGCYFSLILTGILLLRRRWKIDWTLSQYDRNRLNAGANHRFNSSYLLVFRRLFQYTHCNMKKSTRSTPLNGGQNSEKFVCCTIHGFNAWMRLIPSPVDCLLLCWTCFGLFRLISVIIILLGFMQNSAVQEAIFDISLWPVTIGAVAFVAGLVGHDPPRRLIDCAKINESRKRWIYQPSIWRLQLITLFHIVCYPIATLAFAIFSGLQANLFNMPSSLKWDNLAMFTWSIQAWFLAIVGGMFTVECLCVGYQSDTLNLLSDQNQDEQQTSEPPKNILNESELVYLFELTRIYGIISGAGTTVGLWTLMSGLLPPRNMSKRISTPMLSSIAFNCIMPLVAMIIMIAIYKKTLAYKHLSSDNRNSRNLREPCTSTTINDRQSHWLAYNYNSSLDFNDQTTNSSLNSSKHQAKCSTISSRYPSNKSFISTRTMDMQPPSPMRPPPIALQRNHRYIASASTMIEANQRRYSSTCSVQGQTTKRVLIDGPGLRVSAVGGGRPSSLLIHDTENQEGQLNVASNYMSPRGSFSSGDGRGYIIEMYSVEESAYIGREITDSCDSRI